MAIVTKGSLEQACREEFDRLGGLAGNGEIIVDVYPCGFGVCYNIVSNVYGTDFRVGWISFSINKEREDYDAREINNKIDILVKNIPGLQLGSKLLGAAEKVYKRFGIRNIFAQQEGPLNFFLKNGFEFHKEIDDKNIYVKNLS